MGFDSNPLLTVFVVGVSMPTVLPRLGKAGQGLKVTSAPSVHLRRRSSHAVLRQPLSLFIQRLHPSVLPPIDQPNLAFQSHHRVL